MKEGLGWTAVFIRDLDRVASRRAALRRVAPSMQKQLQSAETPVRHVHHRVLEDASSREEAQKTTIPSKG